MMSYVSVKQAYSSVKALTCIQRAPTSLSIRRYINPPLRPSTRHLPTYLSSLSVCLSLCPSVRPSVRPSIHPSINLSIYHTTTDTPIE
jgi:hypothetical protein